MLQDIRYGKYGKNRYEKRGMIEIEIELDRTVSRKRKKEIEEEVKKFLSAIGIKIENMEWIRKKK